MKDLKSIRALVEKYLEGRTSLEQEEELRTFLLEEEVPEDLHYLKDQFTYFESLERKEPRDLEGMLQKATASGSDRQKVNGRTIRMIWMRGVGIAASLIILLGTVLMFWGRQEKDYGDKLADPEVVYQQAQKAIKEVSQEVNEATGELENLSKINKSAGYIQNIQVMEQSMKDLTLFSKFSETKEKITK